MQGVLRSKNYGELEMTKVSDYKRELLRLIKRDALSFGETQLSSGAKSNYYLDTKMVTLSPEGAFYAANILLDMLKNDNIDAIGGMTIGADPIVGAFAYSCFLGNRQIRTFIVRKEQKEHGKHKWIEGPIRPDDKVVVIDDVTTRGNSLIKAIDIIKQETNCEIIKTITLIDRLEGGKESLKEHGYDLISIFDKNDLF